MTYVDALTRISQIEQQISQLSGASTAAAATTSTGTAYDASSAASTGNATASATPSSFADALAQAQDTGEVSNDIATLTGADAGVAGAGVAGAGVAGAGVAGAGVSTGASPLTLASLTGGLGLPSSGVSALPSAATALLTSDQQQFAARLSSDTGLGPGVISAWLLAEESGSAAQSRQVAGNNDWLNIGYTDSGTYGSADSVWSDPVSAADATAGWLKGQDTIPGYGTASSGIQSIVSTAGQPPAAQISALQNSGWASSGYPDLPSLYAQVTG